MPLTSAAAPLVKVTWLEALPKPVPLKVRVPPVLRVRFPKERAALWPAPGEAARLVVPPLIEPEIVALLLTDRVVLAARVTGPLKVATLATLPPRVGVPLSWTALPTVRVAVGRKVPPDSQSVPPPSTAALPRLRVP